MLHHSEPGAHSLHAGHPMPLTGATHGVASLRGDVISSPLARMGSNGDTARLTRECEHEVHTRAAHGNTLELNTLALQQASPAAVFRPTQHHQAFALGAQQLVPPAGHSLLEQKQDVTQSACRQGSHSHWSQRQRETAQAQRIHKGLSERHEAENNELYTPHLGGASAAAVGREARNHNRSDPGLSASAVAQALARTPFNMADGVVEQAAAAYPGSGGSCILHCTTRQSTTRALVDRTQSSKLEDQVHNIHKHAKRTTTSLSDSYVCP
jgi:hypothetical protein